jgi:hypothetical protein
MFDGNINAEWNQNILRNLKHRYPELSQWDDYKILKEWDEYSMCETDETFVQWMQESE